MSKPIKMESIEDFIDGDTKKMPHSVYSVFDTDLARDNLENNLPSADLEDLKK